MDRDWNKYRPYLLDYVNMITEPSKGKDMYICPLCGSGTGSNHTGAFHLKDNNTKWKCYSCEEPRNEKGQNVYGDIYDLYRLKNNCDLNEAYDKIALLFTGETPRTVPTKKETNKQHESIIDFEKWHEALLHNREALEYLKARRITQETINRHKLGLKNELINEEWKNCIIIPMNEKGYIRRAINDKSFKRYNKNVVMSIIDCVTHEKEPIFIVEGWANAFTLEQMGYNAISLNGSGDNNITMALDYAKGKDNAFICMIDDDKKEQNEKLYEMLKEQGNRTMKFDYDMIDRHFYGEKKDVNDYYASEDKLERTHINRIVNEANEKAQKLALEPLNDNKEANILEDDKNAHTANMDAKNLGNIFENSRYDYYNSFLYDKQKQKGKVVSTGFPMFDKTIGGGLTPGLYIVGAVSSLGKTTFCMNIAENLAEQGEKVLFFNLEMSTLEMFTKSLSRNIGRRKETAQGKINSVSAKDIRFNNVTEKQAKEVEEARKNVSETIGKNMHVIECNFGMTADDITSTIENYIKQYNETPIVFIDYMQIIKPSRENIADKQNVDDIASKLKRLQLKYNLIMFVVSSFNRSSYLYPIDYESFKESGSIEYCSDVLWGLQLEEVNKLTGKDDAMGKVAKREALKKAKAEKPRMIQLVCLKHRSYEPNYYQNFSYFSNCDLYEERTTKVDKKIYKPQEKQKTNKEEYLII